MDKKLQEALERRITEKVGEDAVKSLTTDDLLGIVEKSLEECPPEKVPETTEESVKTVSEVLAEARKSYDEIVRKLEPVNTGGHDVKVGGRRSAEEPYKCIGQQMLDARKAVTGFDEVNAAARERIEKANKALPLGLSEMEPELGGFVVKPEHLDAISSKPFETGVLAADCEQLEVGANSNGFTWNEVKESSRATGSRRGGVRMYWAAEGGGATASTPELEPREIKLQKLLGFFYASDEIETDAVALTSATKIWFGEEYEFMIDNGVFRGLGGGQMTGFLEGAGTVAVDKETGQAADTVVAENIDKMFTRMWPKSVPNAQWYISQGVWVQLFDLKKSVGTGGIPVFTPPGGYSAAPYGLLRGRPIKVIEHCSVLGDKGDIVFADLKEGYRIIKKAGLQTAMSIEVAFLTAQNCYRFMGRVNGAPKWNAAVTPFDAGDTLSPIVTLAERA